MTNVYEQDESDENVDGDCHSSFCEKESDMEVIIE